MIEKISILKIFDPTSFNNLEEKNTVRLINLKYLPKPQKLRFTDIYRICYLLKSKEYGYFIVIHMKKKTISIHLQKCINQVNGNKCFLCFMFYQ